MIRRAAAGIAALAFAASAAPAAEPPRQATGSGALALAARVGQSGALSGPERTALAALFEGGAAGAAPSRPIVVTALSVVCRTSDVDLTLHGCEVATPAGTRTVTGSAAQALFATLLEDGVGTEGAAGSIYAAVRDLSCRIDPQAVAGRDGSGATCRFTPDR